MYQFVASHLTCSSNKEYLQQKAIGSVIGLMLQSAFTLMSVK